MRRGEAPRRLDRGARRQITGFRETRSEPTILGATVSGVKSAQAWVLSTDLTNRLAHPRHNSRHGEVRSLTRDYLLASRSSNATFAPSASIARSSLARVSRGNDGPAVIV